jgi:hypothetical protein
MTTELINQFRDFEIFAEKMEALVEAVKNDEENKKNKWGIEQFDLRDDNIGMVDSMPKTLKDYLNLWEYVQQRYKEYLESCENPLMPNEMYFDVYWNDKEANSAFYDGLTLWIYFDYEYGIYYDTDVEICDKIRKRDDELASKC